MTGRQQTDCASTRPLLRPWLALLALLALTWPDIQPGQGSGQGARPGVAESATRFAGLPAASVQAKQRSEIAPLPNGSWALAADKHRLREPFGPLPISGLAPLAGLPSAPRSYDPQGPPAA